MDDLSNYFSLQQRVAELERRLEYEIILREKDNVRCQRRVRREVVAKSKYKRKYEELRDKYVKKPVSRCEKARALIAKRESGELDITLVAIADKCFLGYSTVKALARGYRKKLGENDGKSTP